MSDDAAAAPGGLLFWHPVDDAPIDDTFIPPPAAVAPGSSADVRLRVRNDSDSYAATTVVIAVAGPADADATADVSGEYFLSADGTYFAGTLDLPALAPQSISDAFYLRRVTGPDAPDGGGGFTLTATATSWAPAVAAAPTAVVGAGGDVFDPDAAQPTLPDDQDTM